MTRLGEQIHKGGQLKTCIKVVKAWGSAVFSRCDPQAAASELPGNLDVHVPVPTPSKEPATLASGAFFSQPVC